MLISGSQLIKYLRLRLQDMYKPDGNLITNFLTESGTSWMVDELMGILTNAYVDYHKYRKLVCPSEYITEERISLSGNRKISKLSLSYYPIDIITIKISGVDSPDGLFAYVPAKDYYSKICGLSSVRQSQNMYTVVGNDIILISNLSTIEDVDIIYEYQYSGTLNFSGNIEVYSDLSVILDLAELECRKILGDIEQVKLVYDMLKDKISLLMKFGESKDINLAGLLNQIEQNKARGD